ncbi:MAG: hypothetical protein QOF02_2695 [Blastocatellia bacterium]|jgi:hypothetical protein|nr:hypothetical protein [Blastocatellia bacterium]
MLRLPATHLSRARLFGDSSNDKNFLEKALKIDSSMKEELSERIEKARRQRDAQK